MTTRKLPPGWINFRLSHACHSDLLDLQNTLRKQTGSKTPLHTIIHELVTEKLNKENKTMTYTVMCPLNDDAFAMMERSRLFCDGDEQATAQCEVRGNVEVWTVNTAVNIDNRLEGNPSVLEYERLPLPHQTAPMGGYGRS